MVVAMAEEFGRGRAQAGAAVGRQQEVAYAADAETAWHEEGRRRRSCESLLKCEWDSVNRVGVAAWFIHSLNDDYP